MRDMKMFASFIFILSLAPMGALATTHEYQGDAIGVANKPIVKEIINNPVLDEFDWDGHVAWEGSKNAMLEVHKVLVKILPKFFADPALKKEALEFMEVILTDDGKPKELPEEGFSADEKQKINDFYEKLYVRIDGERLAMESIYGLVSALYEDMETSEPDAIDSFCKQVLEISSGCYDFAGEKNLSGPLETISTALLRVAVMSATFEVTSKEESE